MLNMRASGTFDVKLTPQATDDRGDGSSLGRMSIAKEYHGDLEAISRGEMLTAGTPVAGSAGYVAIERVSGELAGKKGAFTLQHRGIMSRGSHNLKVEIVPDSSTGELQGLTIGDFEFRIEDGKHCYAFEYSLPAAE